MIRTMLSFALFASVACTTLAQETAAVEASDVQVPTTKADPSGTWRWERVVGDNKMVSTLHLKHDAQGKLTGTYAIKRSEAEAEPTEVQNLKLDGNKLTFQVRLQRNANEFTIDYEGTVSDDELRGQTKANFGGEAREFEWNATRVVTSEDVVGTWQLHFERNGTVMEPTLKISNDGEKLTGSLTSPRGDRKIDDIQIKENQLSFQATFPRESGSFSVSFEGTPRGESMTGTMVSDQGGETRKTTISGKRLPEESKEKESPASPKLNGK